MSTETDPPADEMLETARRVGMVSELDAKQKAYIEANWKKPLKELSQEVFADPSLTLLDVRVKLVKQHLATLGKESKSAAQKVNKTASFVLSPEHVTHIQNNYQSATWYELAKQLFGDDIPTGDRRARAVMHYCREIDPDFKKDEELTDEVEYKAPNSVNDVMGLVNRYAIATRPDGKKLLDPSKITAHERRQLQALLNYIHTPLFKVCADKYIRKIDRTLFESTFVSFCWDKPDLMAEEVHQYINLASETVKYHQIERTVQKLDQRLNNILDDPDGKMNMSEVELLNSVREKANASMKQQAALLKALVGERSKKENERKQDNATLHNLVTAFMDREKRQRILKVANEYREKLGEEVARLDGMDSLRADLFGLDKNSILK